MLPTPVELEGRGAGEVYAVERQIDPISRRIYNVERKSGLRYTVYSDERVPPSKALAAVPDGPAARGPDLQPYLALPSDLPPRIAELARTITAGQVGPYRKARAIESYLQRHYRYTLQLGRDERFEPLEDFLFVQKAGHCEYFASAMAVMLRAVGVPTRSVNGFLAGEWNGYGHYLAVRQGDAHSWVEAWLDGVGWITFDPTPATPAKAQAGGLWASARQMLDTVELTWFKYVIEYDLGKQVDFLSRMRDWTRSVTRSSGAGRLIDRRRVLEGIGLAVALMLVVRLGWRRRGLGAPRPLHVSAQHAFARALKALERRGHPRGIAETGRELALRVDRAGDPGAPAFAELVELYYAARFGEAAVADDDLERLAQAVIHPRADVDPSERDR
jgi:hypothetical protein